MTPAERNEAIFDFLSPGSRRCTVECGECGGDKCPFAVCPACNDTGLSFRTDAKGRELILAAGYPEGVLGYLTSDDAPHLRTAGKGPLAVWDLRHELHADIRKRWEQHVREYIAPAPDLLTAMNPDDQTELLLKRLLREAEKCDYLWIAIYRKSVSVTLRWITHEEEGIPCITGFRGDGDTEADALFAAVEAARKGGQVDGP